MSRSPHPARPALSRDVVVLGVIAFFVMVGFGVVVPVLPVYVRTFGVGYLEVGAVLSAFALMRFVFSPFCGRLIDWAGERAVLSAGIGIVAISSALVGLAHTYPEVLLLRGAGGIGSAMFSVAAMTLLLGSTTSASRGRAVGFYQGGFLIGGMAGPALGGVLAAISLTAPFFFYAGTLAVAGTVGVVLLGPRVRQSAGTGASTPPTPFRLVIRDPRFRAACLANFAQGWTSLGVRGALVPVLVVEVMHDPASWTGIAFACAAVAQTLALAPAGTFVDTIGRKPAIIGASVVAAGAILAVAFAPNVWVLTLLMCVYGVASAFLGTAPAASVGDAAGGGGGRPVAVFSMASDFGAILGPLVAGWLAQVVSFTAAFALAAAFLLVAGGYAFRMPREARLVSAPRSGE
ncbi:MFS transporter [Glaciibacter sp. 2TAF33]|uniref:MFS transporter n=1 Tax=Glaciibacter sp. 2TAF33 TaxID=3233015 RepID=UPI003F90A5CC